jgi:hypothetical protein
VNGKNSLDRLQKKLKNVRNDLKGWGAHIRGEDKKKKRLVEELQELESIEELILLTAEQLKRKAVIQKELLEVYENEERFWQQRSRDNWLLRGDNNTEYFHRIANGVRRKKMIFSMKDGEKEIQGTHDLLQHATNYYRTLFGPAGGFYIRLADDNWQDWEKLNDEDREKMGVPFTEKEVKEVIDLVLMGFLLNFINIVG